MCRHTVGLNWTAIGIEHVGYSDQRSARRPGARWPRACGWCAGCAAATASRSRDVIGHNESLSSPYHREDVPSLRTQTHSDFNHADMNVYRRRLARAGGCG